MLLIQLFRPTPLLRSEQLGLRPFRQSQAPSSVLTPDGLLFATGRQLLQTKLAQGLQQQVARLTVLPRLPPNQAFVHEGADALQEIEPGARREVVPGDGLGGIQGEPAYEDGQAPEQALLVRVEQVVAPAD